MNELIKVTERDGKQAVSGRELHQFLESKRQFSNWIKERIEKYGLIEGQDFTSFNNIVKRENGGGTTKVEYVLSLDAAKELAMVEGNERGKQARQYFIECEKKYKEIQIPRNYLSALKALVASEEAKQLSEAKVKELEPPAQYAKEVLGTENAFPITHVAKELGMSAIKLNKQLFALGVQHKVGGVWVLKGKHQGKGYTKMGTTTFETENGQPMTSHHTYWTEKGRQFIHEIITTP